ncbi:MAG: ChaN family lipoprotein [Myxococcales bacterium]|nr:ChaN family lipoprotein [Myxococcales bacterium]MCB9702901.1 ChaN family lipoprotein [Myxococcales bacterium]
MTRRSMDGHHSLAWLVAAALVVGCGDDGSAGTEGSSDTDASTSGASEGSSGSTSTAAESEGSTGGTDGTTTGGQTFPNPDDAPSYDGDAFVGMQIYDVRADLWLDEEALMEGLDPVRLVFVGEQHETPPIHELQRWVLEREILRHGDVALGMEHFQADAQSVIDQYLADEIDESTFLSMSDPWTGYSKYWRQLVETMKIVDGPVIALNIPDEALDSIYASFPQAPIDVFNGWGPAFPYDAYIPPRPLAPWDAVYQGYFEGSFDYGSHNLGLSYDDALNYFTDLALIRDDTMGYHVARHLEETSDRVVMVGGDWHVQTGLATPDSVKKFTDAGESKLITTATPADFDVLRATMVADRPIADYILVYDPV